MQVRTKAKLGQLHLAVPPTPPRSLHGTHLMMTTFPASLQRNFKLMTKRLLVQFTWIWYAHTICHKVVNKQKRYVSFLFSRSTFRVRANILWGVDTGSADLKCGKYTSRNWFVTFSPLESVFYVFSFFWTFEFHSCHPLGISTMPLKKKSDVWLFWQASSDWELQSLQVARSEERV